MDGVAETLPVILCWIVVAAPALGLLITGLSAILELPVKERATNHVTQASVAVGLMAALAMLIVMLVSGRRSIPVELGQWIALEEHDLRFVFKFVFDRLSVAFCLLSFVLCGVVGAFARVYLHREPGYRRFYVLFAVFVLGMTVSSIAGTIETLFAGWELVGLSSAMLVMFFQERPAPVRSGLRVWVVYRVADAAFMVAAVALHHLAGKGDFAHMTGAGVWPEGVAPVTSSQAFAVGVLLLVAAAGKSALVPFVGWLPRAMEGPTPSSAIFYGALSVHLGAFLLLRTSPLLDASMELSALVVVLGLGTAVYAAIAGRTQTDIKSALAFASLTQVGLIVAEIGLGLRYLALAHIIGNACLRTLQLLRAPSLLHDDHQIAGAIGADLPRDGGRRRRRLPKRWSDALYRLGYDRERFDTLLANCVVEPLLRVLRGCDALERRWTDLLGGGGSRESDQIPPAADSLDDAR
jgi:NAD(P)H-quinone oxidoreductase subunit 5